MQAEISTEHLLILIFLSQGAQKSELYTPEPSPEGTNTSITTTASGACPEQGQDTHWRCWGSKTSNSLPQPELLQHRARHVSPHQMEDVFLSCWHPELCQSQAERAAWILTLPVFRALQFFATSSLCLLFFLCKVELARQPSSRHPARADDSLPGCPRLLQDADNRHCHPSHA